MMIREADGGRLKRAPKVAHRKTGNTEPSDASAESPQSRDVVMEEAYGADGDQAAGRRQPRGSDAGLIFAQPTSQPTPEQVKGWKGKAGKTRPAALGKGDLRGPSPKTQRTHLSDEASSPAPAPTKENLWAAWRPMGQPAEDDSERDSAARGSGKKGAGKGPLGPRPASVAAAPAAFSGRGRPERLHANLLSAWNMERPTHCDPHPLSHGHRMD